MNDLIKNLLGDKIGPMVSLLTEKFDFDLTQATAFVPEAISKVTDLFSGGKLDLSNGLDAGALLEKFDVQGLADKVGVDVSQARTGLEGILPSVTDALAEKAGGVEGIASLIGGDTQGILSNVTKLFGR